MKDSFDKPRMTDKTIILRNVVENRIGEWFMTRDTAPVEIKKAVADLLEEGVLMPLTTKRGRSAYCLSPDCATLPSWAEAFPPGTEAYAATFPLGRYFRAPIEKAD